MGLSYDDANLPSNGALVPSDLRDFLKRYRARLDPIRIRFFAVGEYGDTSWRPHYHLAVFGAEGCWRGRTRKDLHARDRGCCGPCDLVREVWGKGSVDLGSLTVESAQYLAGYTVKKLTKADAPALKERGLPPEFTRMSNGGREKTGGIGAGAIADIASTLLEFDLDKTLGDVPVTLRHGKKILPLGRYLRKRLRKEIGRDEKAPDITDEEMSLLYADWWENSLATKISFSQYLAEKANPTILRMERLERFYGKRKKEL